MGYVSATFDDVSVTAFRRDPETVRVISVADDAVEIDGTRVAFPIPTSDPSLRISRKERIRYVFRPADTIDRVVRTVVDVDKLRDYPWNSDRYISIDDGTRPAPVNPSTDDLLGGLGGTLGTPASTLGGKVPSMRQGSVSVNGRLPPEVVQRIVRQNFGRFRLCYESGLAKDATLHGRVVVRFAIDRKGAVSTTSDAGSDLPDKAVVACIVRAMGTLSFPAPEGGIVTVTYPLELAPPK
jgi:hypothetical protein